MDQRALRMPMTSSRERWTRPWGVPAPPGQGTPHGRVHRRRAARAGGSRSFYGLLLCAAPVPLPVSALFSFELLRATNVWRYLAAGGAPPPPSERSLHRKALSPAPTSSKCVWVLHLQPPWHTAPPWTISCVEPGKTATPWY